MKPVIVAVICLFCVVVAFAAEGNKVSYQSGNETVSGVLYLPEGKGPFPALVVVHEWWGLNDWVKEQASKLAGQGYAALAIDLYRGKVATTEDEAHQLSRGLPTDRATQDLLAATAFLRSQRNIDPTRVGAIGWCLGGGYAFDLAVNDPRLKAAVINYGHLASTPETVKKINASMLGIFGAQDKGIPVSSVREFETQMRQQGKKIEIMIFPDAGHGFENPNNKPAYRADDAKKAWEKTVEFLGKNLK